MNRCVISMGLVESLSGRYCHSMNSYSQQGENYFILSLYQQVCHNGCFCRAGAMDGITYSNSTFFEDNFGFNGLKAFDRTNDYVHVSGTSRG